ncbi:LacI family transcriptional regulator [Niabella sp. CC-SYL272]|uniref:LacI family DNA-binding transcriptional regulator n=1 Tax=Niabella agricola TaxID=2891571 RepID=UPI001F25D6C8|nr:LacI family DNA-binding transcriptional regulator [Niabella agricola]MCF3111943.1 LacI family transcriptional regulator [Niabella agricola]
MKKGVTIKDIAAKLNMSVSTVSKALNDNSSISAMTKERVVKLANEWNYVPNEAARHFKQSKSFTLGLVIPDLLDQFYVLAINGVEAVAGANKYQVIVAQSHEDTAKEEQIIQNLISNRVDGVIIAISKNTEKTSLFQRLEQTGIPVVFLSRSLNDPGFDAVVTDNAHAAELAIDYLFKKQHRRIAHLMGPKALGTSHLRLEGYRKALEKRGIPYDPDLVKEIDFTTTQTDKMMAALCALPDPPTAFFTFKSYVSLDALRFLKHKYPERLQYVDIVGFGNLPLIQYLDHKPSASIDENSFDMGIAAAELLLKHIENTEGASLPVSTLRIPCKLIIHHP